MARTNIGHQVRHPMNGLDFSYIVTGLLLHVNNQQDVMVIVYSYKLI